VIEERVMVSEGSFLAKLIHLLQVLDREQAPQLHEAARVGADAIEQGGLIHLFGSGHSVIPVLDAFPRYGAFVGINPLTDPRLMWWNVLGPGGVKELLWLERTEGYIQHFLGNHPIGQGDMLIVVSHGGWNPAPVEAAMFGKERGAVTVAITSLANRARPPEQSSGKHLSDVVDIAVDTGVPIEDALVHLDGMERPVGGASTIVACAAMSQIMVNIATLLRDRGVPLSVFVSPTVPGASVESNQGVFDAYRERMQAAARRP